MIRFDSRKAINPYNPFFADIYQAIESQAVLRGYEIELVAGEEGVSPGQACVFYDAPSGQARVLGGGFIRSATASNTRARETAPPLEAMRG